MFPTRVRHHHPSVDFPQQSDKFLSSLNHKLFMEKFLLRHRHQRYSRKLQTAMSSRSMLPAPPKKWASVLWHAGNPCALGYFYRAHSNSRSHCTPFCKHSCKSCENEQLSSRGMVGVHRCALSIAQLANRTVVDWKRSLSKLTGRCTGPEIATSTGRDLMELLIGRKRWSRDVGLDGICPHAEGTLRVSPVQARSRTHTAN